MTGLRLRTVELRRRWQGDATKLCEEALRGNCTGDYGARRLPHCCCWAPAEQPPAERPAGSLPRSRNTGAPAGLISSARFYNLE
jgi:hypothetical protein